MIPSVISLTKIDDKSRVPCQSERSGSESLARLGNSSRAGRDLKIEFEPVNCLVNAGQSEQSIYTAQLQASSLERFELATLFTPGKSFNPASSLLCGLLSVCVCVSFFLFSKSFKPRVKRHLYRFLRGLNPQHTQEVCFPRPSCPDHTDSPVFVLTPAMSTECLTDPSRLKSANPMFCQQPSG